MIPVSTAIVRLSGNTLPKIDVRHPRTTDATISLALPNALIYFSDSYPIWSLHKEWSNASATRIPWRFPTLVHETPGGGKLSHVLELDQDGEVEVSALRLGRTDDTLLRIQMGALTVDVLDREAYVAMGAAVNSLSELAAEVFAAKDPVYLPYQRTGPEMAMELGVGLR